MEERMPVYLHLPLQILWFDLSEMGAIVVFYIAALIFGGIMWIALFLGPYILITITRAQPRGYMKHLMYLTGWASLPGYPPPSAKRFRE